MHTSRPHRNFTQNILKEVLTLIDPQSNVRFEEFLCYLREQPKGLLEELVGKLPADRVFSSREIAIYEEEKVKAEINLSSPRSMTVVLKATRLCNLRCTYCFSWAEGAGNTMGFREYARLALNSFINPRTKNVDFIWHGGEVTLLPPKIFIKFIWMQQQSIKDDQLALNSLQTNAYDISPEWLLFLSVFDVAIGVSADGPKQTNDLARVTKNGSGTSNEICNGIGKLINTGARIGALVVVNRENVGECIDSLFEHFISLGVEGIDFLNYSTPNNFLIESAKDPDFFEFEQFCQWLINVYDIWQNKYRNSIRVGILENILSGLATDTPVNHCYFTKNCLTEVITYESNGSIQPCDRLIGITNKSPLIDPNVITSDRLMSNSAQILSYAGNNRSYEKCKWFYICNGGCPQDQIASHLHAANRTRECCGLHSLLEHISSQLEIQAP